ncbi:PAS domain S-box protein [Pontibacter cellulosilyticus]|uniref:histidine kinase n=1 Tax=Pontibacter cellulosilyticus TaxID=1720253 RepID=A0A923N8W4_9BACT|nr:PAS domain S-box protein [Pontibacter cellulosilyticus]MBC5993541.1 PAS domain S-box protein [Pontibacter cellulosilyticus]
METNVKILILEHDPNDLELLLYELKKSSLNHTTEVVQTKQEFEKALVSFQPNVILSDYSLPSFDGLSAFHIKQSIMPATPFIIVSGTLGEERAVDLIKLGVTDFALKDKLYQIATKIQRALNEAEDREKKETAELQLRLREEQLQKIMNLSLDMICTLDENGCFVTVNAASTDILGYSPSELIGVRAISLAHEEDRETAIADGILFRNGKDLINYENRYIHKSGRIVHLSWSARWNLSENIGYCIARDITNIKQAEEKIRQSEKRFRTLIQNSEEGLALLAADGSIVERSPAAIRILGLHSNETSGKFRIDLVHPEDLPTINNACQIVNNNPNAVLTVEYRFRMPDGRFKWIETHLHNQLHEPAVAAVVLNFRDITERKLAELALERSEQKYRDLFNLSPTPMWLFDTETLRFLDVNEAAIKHYNYSREEFLSITLKDIRPKEELPQLETIQRNTKGTGEFFQTITRHTKKSGEVIVVDIKNSVLDLDGREVRLVLATDVSERVKHIQAIEEQNTKLREIAWMQSHVVRAPLARLMGLVNLLDIAPTGEAKNSQILHYLQSSAHELDEIIRDIVRKAEQVQCHTQLAITPSE